MKLYKIVIIHNCKNIKLWKYLIVKDEEKVWGCSWTCRSLNFESTVGSQVCWSMELSAKWWKPPPFFLLFYICIFFEVHDSFNLITIGSQVVQLKRPPLPHHYLLVPLLYVCVCAIKCSFLQGLSLALRFQASHWSTP